MLTEVIGYGDRQNVAHAIKRGKTPPACAPSAMRMPISRRRFVEPFPSGAPGLFRGQAPFQLPLDLQCEV